MRRLALIAVLATACVREPVESPEYTQAEAALHETLAETVDPSFGDPKFLAVRELFERVPKDSPDVQKARALIRAIDEGQEQRKKYEADRARRQEEEKAQVDAALEEVRRSLREPSKPIAAPEGGGAAFDTGSGGTYSYSETTDTERSARENAAKKLDQAIVDRPKPPPAPSRTGPVIDPEELEARCQAARKTCLERCAWVVDPNLRKSAGFGSPAHMRCTQQCPVCKGGDPE